MNLPKEPLMYGPLPSWHLMLDQTGILCTTSAKKYRLPRTCTIHSIVYETRPFRRNLPEFCSVSKSSHGMPGLTRSTCSNEYTPSGKVIRGQIVSTLANTKPFWLEICQPVLLAVCDLSIARFPHAASRSVATVVGRSKHFGDCEIEFTQL